MYPLCVEVIFWRTSTRAELPAGKYGVEKETCAEYHGTSGINAVLDVSDIDAMVLAVYGLRN